MGSIDISVIIATRNRGDILWTSVEYARAAVKNKPAEIIIVNDGDEPLIIPNGFSSDINYFQNPGKGVSFARNHGASVANGSILFFVDDDMWISTEVIDWILETWRVEKNKSSVYNINWEYPPSLKEHLDNSKIGRYILSSNYNTMWGRMHVHGNQPSSGLFKFNAIASCSLIMDKSIFTSINGYNEKMIFQGEDIDLSNRLNQNNIPIYCVFGYTLFHNHQDRLEIEPFLERLSNGYSSEFKAVNEGILISNQNTNYSKSKKSVFDFMTHTEKAWIWFLKIMPRGGIFTKINNRLIGALGALQQYKEWKKQVKS